MRLPRVGNVAEAVASGRAHRYVKALVPDRGVRPLLRREWASLRQMAEACASPVRACDPAYAAHGVRVWT